METVTKFRSISILCQLVFFAVLWVKLREMLATVIYDAIRYEMLF